MSGLRCDFSEPATGIFTLDAFFSSSTLNEESDSESSENGVKTQKSNNDETLATNISKTEVSHNEIPIEDLDQNATMNVTYVTQNVEPQTSQKSSNDDADLTNWTVQVPC